MTDFNNEDRYSRQILSIGKDSHLKLSNGIVRITNLFGGLATEVCKNLVLQGIGTLVLNDSSTITEIDLETGFFYVNNLGERRDKILKSKLTKLNPSCKIFLEEEYSNNVDINIYLNIHKNEIEMDYSVANIISCVGGCRGYIFNDFKNHQEIKFEDYPTQLKDPKLQEDWVNPDLPKNQFYHWNFEDLAEEDYLELGPVNAYFGGLIVSETIKFLTKKNMPIKQWFFWEDTSYLNYYPKGRNQIEKLLGEEVYQNLLNQNIFMVGSGAIGCEMLKNLSLLNATCDKGSLKVTDPDTIEVSNLSRQFLFHQDDINKSKSEIAVKKILEFNPKVNYQAFQDKICSETESIYNKEFYQNINIIVNALDNYQARLFMDDKAVEYQLPLFESGTQGSKGNTQPVIPFLTENYGATSDPPESESYPLCTIKNFPNKPEHVVHYVKELFEEWLNDFPEKIQLLKNNNNYLNELTETDKNNLISKINKFYKYSSSLNDQLNFWNEFYYSQFRDNILQILENYPEDHEIDGNPFWSGGKTCPKVLDDKFKKDFIISSIKISEKLYNKKYSLDNVEKLIDELPEMEPIISKNKIALEEKDLEEQEKSDEIEINREILESIKLINPISFDKDEKIDYEWLYQGVKMRCYCYHIDVPDILKIRQISGKIIPALATTTSIVSGLITLEIIKYLKKCSLEEYRSYFLNLDINQYLYSEPIKAKKDKYGSLWDKNVEIEDTTLENLMEKYNKKYDTEICIVVSESKIIYAPFITPEEQKCKKISELGLGNRFKLLFSNDDEEDLPQVFVDLE